MAETIGAESDPFADPNGALDHHGYAEAEITALPVGRDASLTLATDSLIVLGIFLCCLAYLV